MDPLIPAWLLALVVALAIYVQMKQGRYEHAFTRLLLCLFYVGLAIFPETPIEIARFYSRWFFILLFITEVLSHVLRSRGQRR